MKEIHIDIDPEERGRRAEAYFLQGYNCCQAVVLAFADVIGVEEEILNQAASGFGGGMGRMREICGTVSAMVMLAGFVSPADDPSDRAARTANYSLVQLFAGRFREKEGSLVCRELLGIRASAKEAPAPSERTPEYYKSRPCAALVGTSARIVAEYLRDNS